MSRERDARRSTRRTRPRAGASGWTKNLGRFDRRRPDDSMGRLASVTDPAGNVTRYQYGDAADGLEGLLAAVIYPTYRIEYRYDARDRPVQTIQVLNADTQRITRVSYDGKGQVVSRTDPAGHTTLSEYDGLGQVIRVTDALGGVTRYQYDPRGNLSALTDANDQTHRFEYDLADRTTREIRPMGGTLNTGQNSQDPRELLEFFGEIQGDVAEEVDAVAEEGLEGALECFFKGMGLRPSWSSSPVR